MYYVGFTTCTLSASFIFYKGLNTSDFTSIASLLCGFLLNFMGITLLTLSKTAAGDHYRLAPPHDLRSASVELLSSRYEHARSSSVEIARAGGEEVALRGGVVT